jgi:aminomethyltransferase
MGEIELSGPRAAAACQCLTTNDVRRLADGHVQYTLLCRDDGGVVDDVTLYRHAEGRYFFCVNATNVAKDRAWIEAHADGATVTDVSAATALLALQGPRASAILASLTSLALDELRAFRFTSGAVGGISALVSRTGYTGEDGFELYVASEHAVALWSALIEAGRTLGLQPIGLGARDTLRLEAALPLYGHELDDTTTPLAAGLARFVTLDGDDFIGRAALLRERAAGSARRLVGLELRQAGIARQGYPVLAAGVVVGRVTSGTHAPTLGRSIALASVDAAHGGLGTRVAVEIRGRPVEAEVVPTPFYRRPRSGGTVAPTAGTVAPAAGAVGSTAPTGNTSPDSGGQGGRR